MATTSEFGVFILRDGRWQPWTTGVESYARRECSYLCDSLGLNAQVFQRVAA